MDAIIIGGGPAGVTAAIYAVRGGLSVAIVNTAGGSIKKAHKIENFYGFSKPVSGEFLYSEGLKQAQTLGVKIIDAEATRIETTDSDFRVVTTADELQSKFVVIASGVGRKSPNIKGIRDYEGKGVSYCAVCDAFFYRKKNVVVIGNGKYALEEAQEIAKVAASVTVLTDGLVAPETEFAVKTQKISEIVGDGNRVTEVVFADGDRISADGVFVAIGIAGSSALATILGAQTDGDYIVTDQNGATNIPNLFAAGDCTGGLKQVSAAIFQGATVGLALVKAK